MKKTLGYILLVMLFVSLVYIPICNAQNYATWNLPEGAKIVLVKDQFETLNLVLMVVVLLLEVPSVFGFMMQTPFKK